MSQEPEQADPSHRATLSDEAKETSGLTSALLLDYVDRVGGRDAVLAVLRRCGLEQCEAELRDDNSWFSWETKIALFEATAEVLDDPDYMQDLASHVLDSNVAGGLKVALRTLGSPQFVLRNIVRANARFVRSHMLELLELKPGHARLRFSELGDGRRYHRLECQYTGGLLGAIPELFGLPAARVTHAQCAAQGADACVFELHWVERPHTAGRVALSGFAVAATAASAVLAPIALPFVGAGAAVVSGLMARERYRWRRDQWRHLERQVEDSEEVAQRLFASLQDLVSDLRLEEVIAKVTRNAKAAVAGREFLLLVREGERLVCQSSDLPPEAMAAVEAWANASPRALESSLVIDDADALPELMALAGLDAPLRSLASAPLTWAGESFGLLVALGGLHQTFLPRDISVLESYAVQVAIALGNARLYQNERSLASRDPLTGLLNHRSFHEAMDAELERCAREQFHSSLVLIDLDNFKQVNDEDGHAAGDRLLRAAAVALSDACRRDDLAFRIGGDEFALLLPRLTEDEAASVASRACEALGALDARMGASAGLACITPADRDKQALLSDADRRLYAAKRDGVRSVRGRGVLGRRDSVVLDATTNLAAVISAYWSSIERRDWERFGALLADDVVSEAPAHGEHVHGRSACVTFTGERFPGDSRVCLLKVMGSEDGAASWVEFTDADGRVRPGVCFFEFNPSGRIARISDFWPAPDRLPAGPAHLSAVRTA